MNFFVSLLSINFSTKICVVLYKQYEKFKLLFVIWKNRMIAAVYKAGLFGIHMKLNGKRAKNNEVEMNYE